MVSDVGIDNLMTVAEATAAIDARAADFPPRVEHVALAGCVGRRLASDVAADGDYPPFDKALMDGFAVRVGEAAGEFEVVGEVPAGRPWTGEPLGGRNVVAIMTGAPLPAGDVGVVPVERTTRLDNGRVRIDVAAEADRYITRRGGDRPAGATLLRRGVVLGPQHVATLASVGVADVPVFAAPRCAVLSTGDEIVPAHATPADGQVRNANAPMLVALLRQLGGDVVDAGHVGDDLDAVRHALGEWADSSAEALFVTGGMSMGEHDHVPRVLRELGVELHVTKLKVKPGKPFVFGTLTRERGFEAGDATHAGEARRGRRTTAVFGLPGNPVSAFVCTLVLAGRLLSRMTGGDAQPPFVERPLAGDLPANGPRQFYQPATLDRATGDVRPLAWKGSADVFTLAEADALIERPADDPPRTAGDRVRVLAIPGGGR